jgi:hypothetical protein
MVNNGVLDVGIGLIFMYLMLSLMCTTINEIVSTMLGLRAKTLAAAVGQMLDDPTIKADFYDHGLIDGAKAASGGGHPSYLSGRNFAMALLGSLDVTKPVPGFSDIEQSVKNLPASNIRDTLLSQLTIANGNVQTLRDSVATWFDSSMDRVGGIYKRHLKLISLVVGLVIALILGADSVQLAESLWHDSSMRAVAVQSAQRFLHDSAPPDAKAAPNTPPSTTTTSDSAKKYLLDLKHDQESLRPLPLGWHDGADEAKKPQVWIKHALGILLTTLALSLGAPFWFDLLSKFINIRGTGVRPARTGDLSQ